MVWSGQRRTVRVCPLKAVRIANPAFFVVAHFQSGNLERTHSHFPFPHRKPRGNKIVFAACSETFLPLSAPIGDPSALPPPRSIWKHTFISTVSIFAAAAAAAASACRAASACLHGHTASEGRPPSDISPVDLWKLGFNEGWTFLVARRGKAGTRCVKLT